MVDRIDDNRELQRAAEERRLAEQNKTKQRESSEQFQKVVSSQQAAARDKAQQDQSRKQIEHKPDTGGKSAAYNALLARQGIQSRNLAQQLQGRGEASVEHSRVETKSRRDDVNKHEHVSQEKHTKGDEDRLVKQQDRLAPISRDDRGQQGEGGLGGGGAGGSDGGEAGMEMGGQGPQLATLEPGKAEAAEGPHAPRIPPEVVRELVNKVYAGVSAEGVSQFTIEFKDNVLGGARLDVTAKDGKITCTFHTKDKNVGRLLKASEGALMRAFAQKGLTLERLAVADS